LCSRRTSQAAAFGTELDIEKFIAVRQRTFGVNADRYVEGSPDAAWPTRELRELLFGAPSGPLLPRRAYRRVLGGN
jgi:hypothetical protein